MRTKLLIKHILIAIVACKLLMSPDIARAQNQQFTFTQNITNPIMFNPAYAVRLDEGSVQGIIRKQWVGVPGAPTTYALNASLPLSAINSSVGITLLNDTYTIEQQTVVNAFFAKAIKLNATSSLAVSVNAGIRNYTANYTSANSAGASSSDNLFSNNVKQLGPNLGLSVLLYGDRYHIGLSVPQISNQTFGITSTPNDASNYYLSAGYTSRDDEDLKVSYAGLLAFTRDVPMIADLSVLTVIKKQLGLGIDYRTNNELAAIVSFDFDKMHFGYSYQFGLTSSDLGSFSTATHEVTFGIRFGKKNKK